jgi:hypothetical protein
LLQEQRQKVATGFIHTYHPFLENRCIFVHIPKCAGISVSMSLFGNLSGGHTPLRRYSLVFDRTEFRSYFKFAFVRNPWDRLVSGYHYLRDGPGLSAIAKSPELLERMRTMVEEFPDFDSFVKGWVSPENIASVFLFVPQYQFVCINGTVAEMDFIGRYENLVRDYDHVRSRIGVGKPLTWLNRTRSGQTFLDHYTETTRKIVEHVYAEDIRMFGYSFDGAIRD